jgi:Arabinose efflux permease
MDKRTFESLKYRDFSLYFYGQCVSCIGSWMQQLAMGWLIYRLTNSIALLGVVGFCSQIPVIFVSPFSSAIIDRLNKKHILLCTQIFFMLSALCLTLLVFLNILTNQNVWIILVLSILIGITNSFDMPTRQAFYTSLVPKECLSNAVALNSTVINGSRFIGPAIAGVLIGFISEGGCFLINTISYLFVIVAIMFIKATDKKDNKTIHLISDIKEGYTYMKKRLPIKVLLVIMFGFSFFIFPVTTFFPAYAKDILGGDSTTLGILMSLLGLGAFIAALYLASRKSVLGLGKIQFTALLIASLLIIPFFFVKVKIIAFLLAMILGFCWVCSIVTTNTMLQALTESYMKGRIMGYYTMCFIGGSALGSLVLGLLCKCLSLPIVMSICGVMCLIGLCIYYPHKKYISKLKLKAYRERGIVPYEIPV